MWGVGCWLNLLWWSFQCIYIHTHTHTKLYVSFLTIKLGGGGELGHNRPKNHKETLKGGKKVGSLRLAPGGTTWQWILGFPYCLSCIRERVLQKLPMQNCQQEKKRKKWKTSKKSLLPLAKEQEKVGPTTDLATPALLQPNTDRKPQHPPKAKLPPDYHRGGEILFPFPA